VGGVALVKENVPRGTIALKLLIIILLLSRPLCWTAGSGVNISGLSSPRNCSTWNNR